MGWIDREALLPIVTIFSSLENITVDKVAQETGVIHSRCGWGVEGCIEISLGSFQNQGMDFMSSSLWNPGQRIRTVEELRPI
jgi:hypothetical protein